MSSEKLRACPFCTCTDEPCVVHNVCGVQLRCVDCGWITPCVEGIDKAGQLWNSTTRAEQPTKGNGITLQCECGAFVTVAREPWHCGSWHVDCECGKRLKVRLLVDAAALEQPAEAEQGCPFFEDNTPNGGKRWCTHKNVCGVSGGVEVSGLEAEQRVAELESELADMTNNRDGMSELYASSRKINEDWQEAYSKLEAECERLKEYAKDHVCSFIDSDEGVLLSYDEWRQLDEISRDSDEYKTIIADAKERMDPLNQTITCTVDGQSESYPIKTVIGMQDAEIERLKGEVERLTSDIESGFAKGSYARLRNLQEAEVERDQLREALIRLRDCDWTITLPDRMDAVRKIAREALAAGERQGEA